jgi:hypothetical protein
MEQKWSMIPPRIDHFCSLVGELLSLRSTDLVTQSERFKNFGEFESFMTPQKLTAKGKAEIATLRKTIFRQAIRDSERKRGKLPPKLRRILREWWFSEDESVERHLRSRQTLSAQNDSSA